MHVRYCQVPVNMEDYRDCWIITAIVLGPMLLLALADWLTVVVNIGIRGTPEKDAPWFAELATVIVLIVFFPVALVVVIFTLLVLPALKLPPAAVNGGEQHQMASLATSAAQSPDLEAGIDELPPPYSRVESFAPALGSLMARMRSFPPTYQEVIGRTRTDTNA